MEARHKFSIPAPCEDEIIVHVCSNLGQTTGMFLIPKSGLRHLAEHNADRRAPYYFSWNYENDLSAPTISYKPNQLP